MQYTHTVEYYWAAKRNEIQIQTTTQVNLENTTVNERKQAQETTYYMIWALCLMPKLEDRVYRDSKLGII